MKVVSILFIAAFATAAFGQAITGYSGGSEYNLYYGTSTGDAIGYRFTVTEAISATSLGVWNADQGGVMDSPHEVGLWDDTQALLTSVTVTTAGTVVGDFIYAEITPVVLNPGTTYTLAVVYFDGDNDYYLSGASTLTTDPKVTWVNAVYPTAGNLGLTYPALDSAASSLGRLGPNFMIGPVSLQRSTWGSIKASIW